MIDSGSHVWGKNNCICIGDTFIETICRDFVGNLFIGDTFVENFPIG